MQRGHCICPFSHVARQHLPTQQHGQAGQSLGASASDLQRRSLAWGLGHRRSQRGAGTWSSLLDSRADGQETLRVSSAVQARGSRQKIQLCSLVILRSLWAVRCLHLELRSQNEQGREIWVRGEVISRERVE